MSIVLKKPASKSPLANSKANLAKFKPMLLAEPKAPKPPKAKNPKHDYEITDGGDFAAWRIQKPHLAKTLDAIRFRLRMSKSTAPGKRGFWAAYTQDEWCGWLKKGKSAFKDDLTELEAIGLIQREQHRHCGPRVLAFLRPTAHALRLMRAPKEELARVGAEESAVVVKDKKQPAGKSPTLQHVLNAFADAYAARQGQPLVEITPKEKAALKHILSVVEGKAVSLVEWIVENWDQFAKAVQKAHGYSEQLKAELPTAHHIKINLQTAVELAAAEEIEAAKQSKKVADDKAQALAAKLSAVEAKKNAVAGYKQAAAEIEAKLVELANALPAAQKSDDWLDAAAIKKEMDTLSLKLDHLKDYEAAAVAELTKLETAFQDTKNAIENGTYTPAKGMWGA